jgi:hypothetical protein
MKTTALNDWLKVLLYPRGRRKYRPTLMFLLSWISFFMTGNMCMIIAGTSGCVQTLISHMCQFADIIIPFLSKRIRLACILICNNTIGWVNWKQLSVAFWSLSLSLSLKKH